MKLKFNNLKKFDKKKLVIPSIVGVILISAISGTAWLTAGNSEDNEQAEVSQESQQVGEVAGVSATTEPNTSPSDTNSNNVSTSPTSTSNTTQPTNNNLKTYNPSSSPYLGYPTQNLNSTQMPQSNSSEATLDYVQKLHEQAAISQQKCDEWYKKKNEDLAPLKALADEAKRKYDEAVSATENSTLTPPQKSERIAHLTTTLGADASDANYDYLNALNNYGFCPY